MPFWKKRSASSDDEIPVDLPDLTTNYASSQGTEPDAVSADLDGVAIHDPESEVPAAPRRRLPLVLLGVVGGLVVLGGGGLALQKAGVLSSLGLGLPGAPSAAEQSLRDSVAGLVAQAPAGASAAPAPTGPDTGAPLVPSLASGDSALVQAPSPEAAQPALVPPTPGPQGASPAPILPPQDSAALARAAQEAAARQLEMEKQNAAGQQEALMQVRADSAKQAETVRQDSIKQARAARQEAARQAAAARQARQDSIRQAATARRDSIREARRVASAQTPAPSMTQPTAAPLAPTMPAAAAGDLAPTGTSVAKPRPRQRPENLAWDDPRAPWNKKKRQDGAR